ncbi:MAG: hypothetical protein ACJ79O_07710, partial [Myxococcales bacterium]
GGGAGARFVLVPVLVCGFVLVPVLVCGFVLVPVLVSGFVRVLAVVTVVVASARDPRKGGPLRRRSLLA